MTWTGLSWLTMLPWTALFWSCLLPAVQAGGHSTGKWGGQEARAGQETSSTSVCPCSAIPQLGCRAGAVDVGVVVMCTALLLQQLYHGDQGCACTCMAAQKDSKTLEPSACKLQGQAFILEDTGQGRHPL